ncbi:unnamed protein product [Pocillopora meandrina]|uniref:HAT C-terminal dimerisation domain-containing protein n=1 Tax=Pocillopora meandrina TaxID=46732 RepID=A0AAU9WQ67_9CNID|nr:unnamed protein product [Pocillopora meandrina]
MSSRFSEDNRAGAEIFSLLPGNLIECVKYADEDMYPNIRVLLIIGCTLPVSSAEAERSFSGLRRINHISETGCLMSGYQDLHSCTYIMTLTLMLTKSVQSL